MKNLLIIILAASTVALGALNIVQAWKASRQSARMTRLEVEIQERGEQIAELQRAEERAQHRQQELVKLSEDIGAALEKQRRQLSNGASAATLAERQDAPGGIEKDGDKGFGKLLAGMMKDPDIKNMIRDQQRGMLDPLYGPLMKQMKLTPQEAEAFKNILSENMAKAADQAGALLGSPTNRTDALRQMGEEQKKTEEEIRTLLGDDRYAQYKDYQMTVGERTQLNMFRQQNSGEHAINDAQTEQLLAIMREEKQNLAQSGTPMGGMGNDAAAVEAMLSEEQGDRMLQAQEAANERVYERARNVLDEEQLKAFGNYQTNQLRMMRMGINMTRRFLSPTESGK